VASKPNAPACPECEGDGHMNPAVERARIQKALRDCPTPILQPEECIKQALQDHKFNVAVGWSGGKCSTAVLHMALKIKSDISVIFNDTGVEFPETYAFIKKISQEWHLNLEILKPKTTFWTCVKEYGFPLLRGQYKDDSKSKDRRPMCCQLLKEQPILDRGIIAMITGLRASESRMRMFAIAQRGQFYHAKTLKRWNYHPIAFWTEREVWDYHNRNQIPHNGIYDKGHDRCGCWPCTGYLGWRQSLARSHPNMYRHLMKAKGEPTLWEYFDQEGCFQTSRVEGE